MTHKVVSCILMLIGLYWGCSPEIRNYKPENPAEFVAQIQDAFADDNTGLIKSLIINQKDLITTLTTGNEKLAYHYDSQYFTIASDDKMYKKYRKGMIKSYKKLKETPLNWHSIAIQKVSYETDSLQLYIRGLLIVKDELNNLDSIYFNGVKLQNKWTLTKLY